MPLLRRLLAVLAACALCTPGIALGQTSTVPRDGAGVSQQPPVELGGEKRPPRPSATEPEPEPAPDREPELARSGLPSTGSDPRLMVLMGIALMLFGVGLRLRTVDAELY